ncbi:hypothetical protein [Allobaculum mucilyticum]|uniref:hypothetical protein n=1 Tax=Allobaculum mucilyticum TaxID=2834459 RepID=UPI001E541715|nr:hypothetical protein [Allobaculum mucilyticum]UNT96808.1 hypothetical protein KWG62_03370 [Allobaculum mucilyticum]
MKKKIVLTAVFLLSLVPMCFSQYGAIKGVQEVSGFINLTNPIGFLAILLYFAGVWMPSGSRKLRTCLSYAGMAGIVISELNNLLTWNYPNVSYADGIRNCFIMIFPMFYVGLITSIALVGVYWLIDHRMPDQLSLKTETYGQEN